MWLLLVIFDQCFDSRLLKVLLVYYVLFLWRIWPNVLHSNHYFVWKPKIITQFFMALLRDIQYNIYIYGKIKQNNYWYLLSLAKTGLNKKYTIPSNLWLSLTIIQDWPHWILSSLKCSSALGSVMISDGSVSICRPSKSIGTRPSRKQSSDGKRSESKLPPITQPSSLARSDSTLFASSSAVLEKSAAQSTSVSDLNH